MKEGSWSNSKELAVLQRLQILKTTAESQNLSKKTRLDWLERALGQQGSTVWNVSEHRFHHRDQKFGFSHRCVFSWAHRDMKGFLTKWCFQLKQLHTATTSEAVTPINVCHVLSRFLICDVIHVASLHYSFHQSADAESLWRSNSWSAWSKQQHTIFLPLWGLKLWA